MKRLAAVLISTTAGISPCTADAPPGPGLGTPAAPHQVAAYDRDVRPDGTGLPPGEGGVGRGRALYERHCIACHGRDGLGDSADQLAGAQMGLTDEWPEKTIGTYWPNAPVLFDFIRRSMPMTAPGTLGDDEVYALTAYLLYLNGIIDAGRVMDARSLPEVLMPNRDGFVDVFKPDAAAE